MLGGSWYQLLLHGWWWEHKDEEVERTDMVVSFFSRRYGSSHGVPHPHCHHRHLGPA